MADTSPLTPAEQALVTQVERGGQLDLVGEAAVDEAAMRAWDDSHTISAAVIRDIVRGRLAPDPDPHGLRLRGARIKGRIDLENIRSTVDVELVDCLLDEGINARDATLAAVALVGCRVHHPTEPALDAARLTANFILLADSRISSEGSRGSVYLRAAHLGSLDCTDAKISNTSGSAIFASGLKVEQNIYLCGDFEAHAASPEGVVELSGASVGMNLLLVNARMANDSGPALWAENLRVDLNVRLHGFKGTGSGKGGTVRLDGATIDGQLVLSGAELQNDSGPALQLYGARIARELVLNEGFQARGAGRGVVVDLREVSIGGTLHFDPRRLEHETKPRSRLSVDGLEFAGVPAGTTTEKWLALVRHGSPAYAAQPYQHIAAALRAAGHDRETRRTLIAQRRAQIERRALTGRAERAWARLTGVVLGYGYQPWRALIGLFAVIVTAAVLSVVLGGHGALARPRTTTAPASPAAECTVLERVGVGLDLGTPLVTTAARSRCDATDTATGEVLTIAGWVLRLLAWAFATLFIAGFTGAVRKT